MIDEKKLIKELIEKGKKYDEDCGCWERKGEEGNRLICAGKCVGIEQAIEIVKNQPKIGEWIPAEHPPKNNDYVLLSFENFSRPFVGRYEPDEEGGGSYYIGDCDGEDSCLAVDVYVNAWMSLPEPYREGQKAKKQTNADRIRNMTDEELSSFLCKTVYESGENLFLCDDYVGTSVCDGCQWRNCKAYLHWLQSEVEEE